MVSNGEADWAVAVGQGWCCRAGCRGHRDGRASQNKGQLMMVPGKQKRLENDCKDGNERREPTRWVPVPREEAQVRSEVHLPEPAYVQFGRDTHL